MELSVLSDDGQAIHVQVAGSVSLDYLQDKPDPLADLLGENAYTRFVLLDMHSVDALDSSGVSWLLSALKRFRSDGGTLVLHSLSPIAHDILKILNMHLLFNIAQDEREAVESVQGVTP